MRNWVQQSLVGAIVITGGWLTPADAEIVKPQQTPADGSKLAQSISSTNLPQILPQFGGQITTGPGSGSDRSYGAIEGFIPLRQIPGQDLTFLQGRLSLTTDNAQLGGNLLLGHRFFSANQQRIFGSYLAYDVRDTGNNTFSQLGLGLESLGNWDIRLNAAFPLGTASQTVSETVLSNRFLSVDSTNFQGNFLLATGNAQSLVHRRLETALRTIDLETGTRLASLGAGDLRGYGGLYYYSGDGVADTVGWRLRLEARPNNALNFGLALQRDDLFGTHLTARFGFSFSGGRSQPIPPRSTLARMGQMVDRSATIPVLQRNAQLTLQRYISTPTALTNPKTGQPWFFHHVVLGNNSGNGSIETPFGTVQVALANSRSDGNSIVYVQAGNNSIIPPFGVPDAVQVLSTGPQQLLTALEATVPLPLSNSGLYPSVVGVVGQGNGVIQLGNNTTLSGFDVTVEDPTPVSGRGIHGIQAVGVENVTIRQNIVRNGFGEGIYLENASGTLNILDNQVYGTRHNPDPQYTEFNSGIFLSNYNGKPVNATIQGNLVEYKPGQTSYDADGIEVNLCRDFAGEVPPYTPCTTPTQGIYQIVNNRVTGDGTTTGGADGIDTNVGSSGQGTFVIQNNLVEKTPDNGITFDGAGTAQATFTINNNTLQNIGRRGITVEMLNETKANLTITNNQISNLPNDGMRLQVFGNSVLQANISGNRITQGGGDGIEIELGNSDDSASDTSQATVNISQNKFSAIGSRGINITTVDQTRLQVLINSNTFETIGSNSIRIRAANNNSPASSAAKVFAGIRSNSTTGNITLTVANSGQLCSQLQNNTAGAYTLGRSGSSIHQIEDTLNTNIPNLITPAPGSTIVPVGFCQLP